MTSTQQFYNQAYESQRRAARAKRRAAKVRARPTRTLRSKVKVTGRSAALGRDERVQKAQAQHFAGRYTRSPGVPEAHSGFPSRSDWRPGGSWTYEIPKAQGLKPGIGAQRRRGPTTWEVRNNPRSKRPPGKGWQWEPKYYEDGSGVWIRRQKNEA